MRALLSCCVATVAVAASGGVFAACDNPPVASVPDGATATMDQLLQAQADVKTYVAAMETYLACLTEELETAGDDAPAEFKSLMTTRYNTAVSEMEAVAQAFNDQVRAYRAANPSE